MNSKAASASQISERWQAFRETLRTFPWGPTLATLRERFREDRLGLTASSLTFTTTLSLVPLVALILAVFTAFPMFGKLQDGLQRWLIDSLMPEAIARQVLGYITQFASKASRLGAVGLVLFIGSALALMLTIDKTLNQIWRVKTPRPLAQRVLVYWGALTLGPLLLALSISATTWALAGGFWGGKAGMTSALVRSIVDALQFVLLAAGCAALYHHVPHTAVRWSHAWVGGMFVAVALEAAQRLLTLYLKAVPSYSVIYGAFATVPVLLIWVFVGWLVVLFGAVIVAYLPTLLAGVQPRRQGVGAPFVLCLDVLADLQHAQAEGAATDLQHIAKRLHTDPLAVSVALQSLNKLHWAGQLQSPHAGAWVLLVPLQTQSIQALLQSTLLDAKGISEIVLSNPSVSQVLDARGRSLG